MTAIHALPVEKRFATVARFIGAEVEVGYSYLRGPVSSTVRGKVLGVARPLTGSQTDSLVLMLPSELVTISLATIRTIDYHVDETRSPG
jgi:hypothetical protein